MKSAVPETTRPIVFTLAHWTRDPLAAIAGRRDVEFEREICSKKVHFIKHKLHPLYERGCVIVSQVEQTVTSSIGGYKIIFSACLRYSYANGEVQTHTGVFFREFVAKRMTYPCSCSGWSCLFFFFILFLGVGWDWQGNGPIRQVETCPDFFFSLQGYTKQNLLSTF
jgi:hypothetical protein